MTSTDQPQGSIIKTGDRRAQLYAIAFAIVGLLGGYGIVTAEEGERWLRLAEALIQLSPIALAWLNTPRSKGRRAK